MQAGVGAYRLGWGRAGEGWAAVLPAGVGGRGLLLLNPAVPPLLLHCPSCR